MPELARKHQPPASIDLVWEESRRVAEGQAKRHADLDSKTTPLLAFGLAFAVLLRQTTVSLPIEPQARDVLTGFVVIGLVSTLAAIFPRDWKRVPNLLTFIEDANFESAHLKARYLRNYIYAYLHNEQVLKKKYRWYEVTVGSYIVALTIAAALTIWPHV